VEDASFSHHAGVPGAATDGASPLDGAESIGSTAGLSAGKRAEGRRSSPLWDFTPTPPKIFSATALRRAIGIAGENVTNERWFEIYSRLGFDLPPTRRSAAASGGAHPLPKLALVDEQRISVSAAVARSGTIARFSLGQLPAQRRDRSGCRRARKRYGRREIRNCRALIRPRQVMIGTDRTPRTTKPPRETHSFDDFAALAGGADACARRRVNMSMPELSVVARARFYHERGPTRALRTPARASAARCLVG